MDRSIHNRSVAQKAVLLGLETLLVLASYWILFAGGFQSIAGIFGAAAVPGELGPRELVFLFNCVAYLLYWITIAYLVRREIAFSEAFSIVFAFGIYYVGYSFFVFARHVPLNWVDAVALGMFVLGFLFHTVSELQRHHFKRRPENAGKLYTGGLFRYAMHINYLGDILWVSSYAIVTRNSYAVVIPVFLVMLFIFSQIPDLDKHLASHYGEQFEAYRKRTRRLIPFVW